LTGAVDQEFALSQGRPVTKISVVGLGKLGACMAACFASKGFPTVGVDSNTAVVDMVNEGRPPVFEPGLAQLMSETRGTLRATTDYTAAITDSDVTFVVVPTPSESHGGFSLKYVKQVMVDIGRPLASKADYHLIVLTSTVLPGSTEYGVRPLLERASGRRCGPDVGLCYSPEFIALGTVIRDLLHPDFVLIGESDPRAGDLLASVYRLVCQNDPPFVRMNFTNAELTKIAVNTYMTMKITFANTLAAFCEQLPTADVDVVAGALALDSHVGARSLKGGLGYGGPCLPRDNLALEYLGNQIGRPSALLAATDASNRAVVERLAQAVEEHLAPGSTVAVLGLAYKPNTNVVQESQGLRLADHLSGRGVPVVVWDPVAMGSARAVLAERVVYAGSLKEALGAADVVVVANPDPAFADITSDTLTPRRRPVVVIDVWRTLRNTLAGDPHVRYVPIGVGGNDQESIRRLRRLWNSDGPDR
jgi:UDPglucose 6-dehydrogenase